MTIESHPDFEILQRYSRQADAPEFDQLRLHLAACSECRAQLDAMTALAQYYPWLPQAACEEQQQQRLEDYVAGRLPEQQMAATRQAIHDDPAALKAALHQASHRAAMQQTVADSPLAPARPRPASAVFPGMRQRLRDWFGMRAPLWLSVPATALVVAVLAVGVQTMRSADDNGYTIVNYQDNPVIQFRGKQPLPGIGFFNRADSGVAAYGELSVSMQHAGRISLRWPPVANALSYRMRLQVFQQGEKRTIGEVVTDHNTAQFSIDDSANASRYEWVLTGQTRDEKTFLASGGFVIDKR